VEKYDHAYEPTGISSLLVVSAPLMGWRHVKIILRTTLLTHAKD
jgi:hypothetical protein